MLVFVAYNRNCSRGKNRNKLYGSKTLYRVKAMPNTYIEV